MFRTRSLLLASLLVTAVPAAVGAQAAAAAPKAQTDYAAPYSGSTEPVFTSCSSGATCGGTAVANPQTGQSEATVSYDRSTPALGTESVSAQGTQLQTVRVPKGTQSATVTATWRVTSAVASASATTGRTSAGSVLTARILCDGCVTTAGSTQVTLACDNGNVLVCPAPRRDDVVLTVTTSVQNLERASFQLRTAAEAYVFAFADCADFFTTSCTIPLEPEHAGTARSSIDATLVGLHVDPS